MGIWRTTKITVVQLENRSIRIEEQHLEWWVMGVVFLLGSLPPLIIYWLRTR